MKERPILMSGPLVLATMKGLKTQTRRVMNPQPGAAAVNVARCPYGVPGDRAWVREAWASKCGAESSADYEHAACVRYRAGYDGMDGITRWRPSIHMPRWASRLTLEITEVRAERVQDISEEDAKAEGVAPLKMVDGHFWAFRDLWDRINGDRCIQGRHVTWECNPWVWAITYRVVTP